MPIEEVKRKLRAKYRVMEKEVTLVKNYKEKKKQKLIFKLKL